MELRHNDTHMIMDPIEEETTPAAEPATETAAPETTPEEPQQ